MGETGRARLVSALHVARRGAQLDRVHRSAQGCLAGVAGRGARSKDSVSIAPLSASPGERPHVPFKAVVLARKCTMRRGVTQEKTRELTTEHTAITEAKRAEKAYANVRRDKYESLRHSVSKPNSVILCGLCGFILCVLCVHFSFSASTAGFLPARKRTVVAMPAQTSAVPPATRKASWVPPCSASQATRSAPKGLLPAKM